jgi:YegS/Rv2252/BmrU family lipid kinase
MRHAALIYNPCAGRQRHARVLDDLVATLRQGGYAAETVPTRAPGDATNLARELAAAGRVEAVFAFGGDGTVREVAAGLLGSGVALGILPGGTVNLLAMALGLPRDPAAAAAVLCAAPARPMDVGLAGDSPFLMMVSAGLDASVLAAVDPALKLRFGQAAIVGHGLLEWWRYGYPRLEVIADGERLEEATFAAVSNIPYYAGAFRLAPGARLDDRRLDLVLFRGAGRLATVLFAADLLRAAHVRRSDVLIRQVEGVVFAGPAGAAAQLDGDLCQETVPLRVRLSPETIQILAPKNPESPEKTTR